TAASRGRPPHHRAHDPGRRDVRHDREGDPLAREAAPAARRREPPRLREQPVRARQGAVDALLHPIRGRRLNVTAYRIGFNGAIGLHDLYYGALRDQGRWHTPRPGARTAVVYAAGSRALAQLEKR